MSSRNLEKIVPYSTCTSVLNILLIHKYENTVCSQMQIDHDLLSMLQKGKNNLWYTLKTWLEWSPEVTWILGRENVLFPVQPVM